MEPETRPSAHAATVDDLLTEARADLDRLSAQEAAAQAGEGALLVDIRADSQRERDGLVPGAYIVARNVLEWRLDPRCADRDPALARPDVRLILLCNQGYQSSLAAATVRRFGLDATDVEGGFEAWREAGLPVEPRAGNVRNHWEGVYAERAPTSLSWFEPAPRISLELIDGLGLDADAPVIDVGGGASHLAAELLDRGHEDVTVTDISAAALERARNDLGARAGRVRRIVADARDHDFGRRFALWHDRAVFHFMVSAGDRAAYIATLERSIGPGGHVIVATFGPDGPPTCSGLPVSRYSEANLADALGDSFALASSRLVDHTTPGGNVQQFLFAHLQRR